MPPRDLLQRLERAGQTHLLRFYGELPPAARARLLEQIGALDLDALPELVEQYVRNTPAFALPPGVEPAPYYPSDPASPVRPWNAARARAAGSCAPGMATAITSMNWRCADSTAAAGQARGVSASQRPNAVTGFVMVRLISLPAREWKRPGCRRAQGPCAAFRSGRLTHGNCVSLAWP